MLPNLPQINNQQEAKFGVKFRHWLEKNPQISGSYELKDSHGKDSIPFSEVTPEQIAYGLRIRSDKGCLMRIEAIVKGMPDYIYCRNMPSFFVINWTREFHIISVTTFLMEKEKSKRKRLTLQRSKDIAIKIIK